jgi:archaellum component FlaC
MDKLNTTNGVFLDIIANDTELSKFDVFINGAKDTKKNKQLIGYTKEYKDLTKQYTSVFEKLALLEELILQQRAIYNLTDIKVSFVREYIYVRTPFFRRNHSSKDIRVLVDRNEFWDITDDLMNNPKFVEVAKQKLLDAMNASFNDNLEKYQKLL